MADVEVTSYESSWDYHRCSTPFLKDTSYGKGSIWRCGKCGRYWWKTKCIPANQPIGMFAGEWEKVHWWNFKIKRRITEIQEKGD